MKLGTVNDFVDGEATKVETPYGSVAVIRLGESFYAIGDTCTHEDVSLSDGDVDDFSHEIECPKHGSVFSLTSGEPQCLPATQPVPVYTVHLQGDDVVLKEES